MSFKYAVLCLSSIAISVLAFPATAQAFSFRAGMRDQLGGCGDLAGKKTCTTADSFTIAANPEARGRNLTVTKVLGGGVGVTGGANEVFAPYINPGESIVLTRRSDVIQYLELSFPIDSPSGAFATVTTPNLKPGFNSIVVNRVEGAGLFRRIRDPFNGRPVSQLTLTPGLGSFALVAASTQVPEPSATIGMLIIGAFASTLLKRKLNAGKSLGQNAPE